MSKSEQQITIGTKVQHYSKGYTGTVTSIYDAPGYRCLTARLDCDNGGTTCCPIENLRVA